MTEWANMFNRTQEEMTLMERHIRMLKVTREMQPIGIIRLSEILDVPKHKVRYSLRLLEQDGLIKATNEGAVVTEKYEEFMRDLPAYLEELISRIREVESEIPIT